MGTDRGCSPEVLGIVSFFEQSGIPGRVTSTLRRGAVTAAGNPSRHARGLAVDLAAEAPGWDSSELARIFELFAPMASDLNELIYAGPQVGLNVKAGRWVKKYAQDHHHDHIHVAVDSGVILTEVTAPSEAPRSDDLIDDMDGREDMTEPVDAIVSPQGGIWVLTRDGGVRTYDDTGATSFYGSYPGLPPEARQGQRTFVKLQRNERDGYDLISSGGEVYSFPLADDSGT